MKQSETSKEEYSTIEIAVPLAVNYLSSVSVVLVNKDVTRRWPFGNTLTCIHFLVTFGVLALLCFAGYYKYKRLPLRKVVLLSISFAMSIVLNNLSIQHNTVGFYQTMKIAITPLVAIIEVAILHYKHTRRLYPSITCIVLGVGLTTVKDFSVNIIGFFYGVSSVFATAIYQILSRTKQQELQCSSLQLLLFETPIAALILLCVLPLVENYSLTDSKSIWNANYSARLIAEILYTACAAVAINISIFLAIRRSSALTYNVISQLKGLTILIIGTILFEEHLSFRDILGMTLAVVGIVDYTTVRLRERKSTSLKQN